MQWHIGQRVVCIGELVVDFRINVPIDKPVIGIVYTIRGFNLPTPECPIEGTGCGFYLEEIINRKLMFADGIEREISFDQAGFRPVKETNIDVFMKMLESPKVPA